MTVTDVLAVVGAATLLAVIITIARSVPDVVREVADTIHRLIRRRMSRRLPNPDPAWRLPLTRLRYRIGLALLRPYLARVFAFTHAMHDELVWQPVSIEPTADDVDGRGRERFMFGRWVSVAHLMRLEDEAGFGEGDGFRRKVGTREGWPIRFRIWSV